MTTVLQFLTSIVVDGHDEGQRGAKRHDAGDWRRPGSLARLDLHPTIHVVT